LDRADLRQDRDASGWFLDFHDNAHRTVKTRSSERLLPLHRDITSGLLAHIAAVPAGGLLFRSMAPDPQRNADNMSSRFKRLLKGMVDLDAARLSFHSFRHSFEDHAEERLPDAGKRAMTGHAKVGASRSYGRGPGLKQMVEWTALLDPLGVR
jgi:integrase